MRLPSRPDVLTTHLAGRTRSRTASPAGAVDLTPLVEMIERLQGENQRLTAATTAWQFRARAAEDRLAALEAGEPVTGAPRTHNTAPQRDETRDVGSDLRSRLGGAGGSD
jgi:hypothetical protein